MRPDCRHDEDAGKLLVQYMNIYAYMVHTPTTIGTAAVIIARELLERSKSHRRSTPLTESAHPASRTIRCLGLSERNMSIPSGVSSTEAAAEVPRSLQKTSARKRSRAQLQSDEV